MQRSLFSPSSSSFCSFRSVGLTGTGAALLTRRRHFYSGLDPSRVERLRRSGMTFNKPRGRDTFSLAFESRLRLVPWTSPEDLYGPIDVSFLSNHIGTTNAAGNSGNRISAELRDPTTLDGNPVEQRKVASGDARYARIREARETELARLRERDDWYVIIADPIAATDVEKPIRLPSERHPWFDEAWANPESVNRGIFEPRQGPQLRLTSSDDAGSSADLNEDDRSTWCPYYTAEARNQLRQQCDTTLLRGRHTRTVALEVPASSGSGFDKREVRHHFHVAPVVEPILDVRRFEREEAQIELITAYRNLLYEAAELFKHEDTERVNRGDRSPRRVADVLRVPALSTNTCGPRFAPEMGKLSQQSAIKGFHRLSNEAKEMLIMNRAFTLELYVPVPLLEQFEVAFLEEAWPTPESTMNPGRVALYPGLAPPRTLLQYDGWIGKRPELVEAIETEGRSLETGTLYQLDGSPVEKTEALSNIRVYGADEERRVRLEKEAETAAATLLGKGSEGKPAKPLYAPLRAGLNQEMYSTASSQRDTRTGDTPNDEQER